MHTKYQLDLVGYDGQYTFGLWVIEPGGQSIKIGGIIQSDPNVGYYASFGDPQWCLHACSWGLTPGYVDPSRIYKDADDMRISNGNNDNGRHKMIGLEKEEMMIISDINNGELKQLGIDWEYILFVSMGMMIIFGLCAIGYFKCYGDEAPNYKLINSCCSEYISV